MSDSKHNHAIGERSAGLLDIEGKIIRDSVHARLFGGEPEPHRIGGHEVKQRLGTGGMGEVYLAHNKKLGRDEAIKVLRTGDTRDSRAQQRLLSEAQALARLSHPNVVQVHGSDVTEDGGVYIVMEFIEGPTLEQWQRAKPRTWRELLAVYSAAGRGLAAAHRAGLVHRDFKPSNVLLGKDDGPSARLVKVIDFGLAIDDLDAPARGAVGAGTSLRRSTALIGTPFYLSPEQCDGDRSTLTPKSDQFSFCVALYEALYDQHPFFAPDRVIDHSRRTTEGPAASPPQPATNPSRITALIHAIRELPLREPPPQSTAPRRIFRILKRGLERKPADRYDSMDDLLKLLEREQRPAYLRGLAVAGAAGLLIGSTGLYMMSNPPPESCENLPGELEQIWNPERAATLETNFARSGLQSHASAAQTARDALDNYTNQWTDTLRLACSDTYQVGKLDRDTYQNRVRCLDSRRAALAATIDTLTDDPTSIYTLDLTLAALPPIADCAAITAPRCGDPEALRAIDGLPEAMAQARQAERAGRYGDAVGFATTARALAQNNPLVLAEAALLQGRVLFELASYESAEAALQDAFFAADQAGCSGLAVDAANRLAKSLALNLGQEVTSWWAIALNTLDKMHTPEARLPTNEESLYNLRKAEVYNNRGLLRQRKLKDPDCEQSGAANCGRDLKGAEADFREALRLRELVEPRPLAELSSTQRNLGVAMTDAGNFEAALGHFKRALALAQEAFGSDHPATWKAHLDLGKFMVDQGFKGPQTLAHLETALRLAGLSLAPGSLSLAEIQLQLAVYYDNIQDSDRSRAHATTAADIARALGLPVKHYVRLNAMRMLGHALHELDRLSEALEIREQVLAGTPKDDLEELLVSHLELAITLSALRRWPEALQPADAAYLFVEILGLAADDPLRLEVAQTRDAVREGLAQPSRGGL